MCRAEDIIEHDEVGRAVQRAGQCRALTLATAQHDSALSDHGV
jgi:hypothetical protein